MFGTRPPPPPKRPENIIDFVINPDFLNRPGLYPRQGTLLKTIFLEDELFCADHETEILTQRGWKRYDEVIEGEDVLALDPVTGSAEWVPAEHINVFPVENHTMILMESGSHSSLTTPNHRWLSERIYAGGGRIYAHGSYERRREFVETRDLNKRDAIPCAADVINLPDPKWSDGFVELAGWYWTEGTACHHGGVTIGQSMSANPEKVAQIRRCLVDLYGPASPGLQHFKPEPSWCEAAESDRGMVYFRLNEEAALDLRWVIEGKEKVLASWFVASLSREQLHLFIDTSIAADGTVKKGFPSTRVITQKRRESLDVLQMACSLAGIRTTLRERIIGGKGPYAGLPEWELSLRGVHKRFVPQPATFCIEEQAYTGVVWCPTTKHGTWLARRKGTVYFTGNTEYDHQVLGQWAEGFKLPDRERWLAEHPEWETNDARYRYEGLRGIQPDIYERIAICKSEDRKWFREAVMAIGRRGSKGHIGAYCGARVLWEYICRIDPHKHYGIDPNKRLAMFVFAAKKEAARDNQWRDLYNIILGAPCFAPYISRALGEILTIFAPADFGKQADYHKRGLDPAMDLATFEISPKESTGVSARGPAVMSAYFDEMAHVVKGVAKAEAKTVYDQATPALATFGGDAFLYEGSSTWEMAGQFYDNFERAFQVDPETREPMYPEMIACVLESWDLYEDWEIAHLIPMSSKHEQRFVEIKNPVIQYDKQMQRVERANRDTFRVEYRSHWATVLDAYLDPDLVDEMFGAYNGQPLHMQQRGALGTTYVAHGDPSKSGANFGWSIAHTEGPDRDGLYHVVYDHIHAWIPADYEDGRIDYIAVEKEIEGYVDRFIPSEVTFDQFNSVGLIANLKLHVQKRGLPKRVQVYERTATHPLNWKVAESFKTALGMGLLHAPPYELAEQELKFLRKVGVDRVDHPTAGPVQTKDVADAMMWVAYSLIGEQMSAFLKQAMSGPLMGAMAEGGMPQSGQVEEALQAMSNFRGQAGINAPIRPIRGRQFGTPRRSRRGY